MLNKIRFSKPFIPNKEEFLRLIGGALDSGQLTNIGPISEELEEKLQNHLGVENVVLVSNGTIALQLAIKLLGLSGMAITTPFTFIATTSSMVWENITPIFSDIKSHDFNLDISSVTEKELAEASAIIATHVFGRPCDYRLIGKYADKYNLKVIYDAAHAFGVKVGAESLLSIGDVSTLSFHATKIFQTIEGGAIITKNKQLADDARLIRSFGRSSNGLYGINAKLSEIHAAMGLSSFNHIEEGRFLRQKIHETYTKCLPEYLSNILENSDHNYSYYPIIFKTNQERDVVYNFLLENKVESKKYFQPSLDTYFNEVVKPNSKNIVEKILCLPIYPDLKIQEAEYITNLINSILDKKNET
jgi:dTDP-4-amino-4,6-dideoxygalactose transaminase